MPRITARVSQATFDLIRQKGIQVGAVLDWLCANYDEETAKEFGFTVPRRSGRPKTAEKAEITHKKVGKTPPKRL